MATTIRNFGGNVVFTPKDYYRPENEKDILEILRKHKGGTIRAKGSLHAWSDGIVSSDAFIDLGKLNSISITKDSDGAVVTIGAGCTLKRLLKELKKQGLTLPTLGAITEQTIAGVVSTATHGSGSQSISEFVEEISIAAYDKSGDPKVFEWKKSDPEFKAAQCSVGCMGVITSVTMRPIPRYWVEEYVTSHKTIKDVLMRERDFPLQSSALFPYSWKYFSFDRRKISASIGSNVLKRKVARFYDYLTVEIGANASVRGLMKFTPQSIKRRLVPILYKYIMPAFMREKRFVSDSEDGLTLHTLHHYAFHHLEMEVFIPQSKIEEAMGYIKELISIAADSSYELSPETIKFLDNVGMKEGLKEFAGSYQHHYPLFIRSILEDSGYIAMTQGGKYYSVSFFTFDHPSKQQPFYSYATFIGRALSHGLKARFHWGKFFPLEYDEIKDLFPEMDRFHNYCNEVDPLGSFHNDYTKRVLGL